MNFRNKKVIYSTCLGTMALGMVLIAINPTGSNRIARDRNAETKQTINLKSENEVFVAETSSSLPTSNPTPSQNPLPTPLPVYPLIKAPSELNALITKYYTAKLSCDIDTLKATSSSPSEVISKKSLVQLVEGIEDYRDIRCYAKKSYTEGAYIVYVYYEIKFISLDTCAPALSKLYVVTDKNGELKIFDGEMSKDLKAYFNARSEDEDVKELKNYTEERAQKAKEQDKKLKDYWDARN